MEIARENGYSIIHCDTDGFNCVTPLGFDVKILDNAHRLVVTFDNMGYMEIEKPMLGVMVLSPQV